MGAAEMSFKGDIANVHSVSYSWRIRVLREREESRFNKGGIFASLVVPKMIMYPRPGWSLSLYDFVDIIYAAVNAIIVTIPIVAPPSANAWYIPYLILGPCFSPAVVMEPLPMLIISIVIIFDFCLAFAIGFLVHSLGMAASYGTMDRAWGCFAMLPFTLLLCLGLPEARTKFSSPIRIALVMVCCYYPVGFYLQDPYMEVGPVPIILLFSFGVSTGLAILWKLLHWIPYKGPEPIAAFLYASADFFDIITGYFDSTCDHIDVIKAAGEQFNAKCIAVAQCNKVSPAASEVIWNLAGELFSLYDCLKEHQFDSITHEKLWEPVASDVLDIRSAVGKVLRKTADGHPTEADIDMLEKIKCLQKHAGEASIELKESKDSGEEIDRAQTTRFYYALQSVLSVGVLAEKYRVLQVNVDKAANEKADQNKQLSLCTKLAGVFKAIANAIESWLKRPLFNDLHGCSDLVSRMRIPLRTALSMSIVCTLLALWGDYSETIRLHGFWAVIPQYSLYLPTAGATLLKGTKRIVGTLLGGALAVLCLYLHPGNMAAFYVENVVLVMVAKFGLKNKTIDYATYVFSYTWVIVGWGSILVPRPESEQFSIALWRFVFTTGGVLLVILTSCLISPNFAATRLIKASERSIGGVAEGIAPFLIHRPCENCDGVDERLTALMKKWGDFGRETYNEIALRINLMGDASAEIAVYGKIHLVPELSKRVWLKQKYITDVQRSGLILLTSAVLLYSSKDYSGIHELVSPASDRICSLGKAVEASAARMTELLKTGIVSNDRNISNADDDLHVEVQKCVEAMHDLQDQITDEFLANPKRCGDAFAVMKLFHVAYALSDFALVWEQLENALMGMSVPCEMVERSSNHASSTASNPVPTLRESARHSSSTA